MATTDHSILLEAILDAAIDGILVIDDRGVLLRANAATARLFGYEVAEIIGRNVSALMPPPDAERHDGYIARYLRTGEARIIGIGREVEGRRKDGTLFPFRLSVGEVALPDRTLFTGVVHDLSQEVNYRQRLAEANEGLERKVVERTAELRVAMQRLEAEIEVRHRAEALVAQSARDAIRALERERELGELKSRFVSLASHEFRTPLSTILSSAELISRYTEARQQDRRDRHIERIRKSVLHLTDVLNDFLSLGRMDEGRLAPTHAHVHVPELLRDFVEYIAPTLKPGQHIDLNTALAREHFRTDERFLRNILNNLVSNASKYSELGSTIRLDVATAADVHADGTGALTIEVRDEGIGIPADEQARLFDRFFRARNVENIQGTGLGLHIVTRYLQLLGGTIDFESVEGEGTVFRVVIPEGEAGSLAEE